jgi:hypothetical protein
MRRRELITLLGSAAAAWPLELHAYHAATPVVGFLYGGSRPIDFEEALKQGLRRLASLKGKMYALNTVGPTVNTVTCPR